MRKLIVAALMLAMLSGCAVTTVTINQYGDVKLSSFTSTEGK